MVVMCSFGKGSSPVSSKDGTSGHRFSGEVGVQPESVSHTWMGGRSTRIVFSAGWLPIEKRYTPAHKDGSPCSSCGQAGVRAIRYERWLRKNYKYPLRLAS